MQKFVELSAAVHELAYPQTCSRSAFGHRDKETQMKTILFVATVDGKV